MALQTPTSLQNICLDYVASEMCTFSDCCNGGIESELPMMCSFCRSLQFSDHIYLHSNLADALLSRMSDKKTLCCETLSAFSSKSTSLRCIKIHSQTWSRYHRRLNVLNQHEIVEFSYEECVGMRPKAVVNKLIGCLSNWSRANLRLLNVAGCTFTYEAGHTVVIALASLRELRTLNVSRTEFDDNMLQTVISELPKLESIDISSTLVTDISPLSKCRQRLRSLAMYNVYLYNCNIDLSSLSELRHLDISCDPSRAQVNNPVTLCANEFLAASVRLEKLESLDISGKPDVDVNLLSDFIESHTDIQFIGLYLTGSSNFDDILMKYQNNIKFTSAFTLELLMETCKHYVNRPHYMQKALFDLFRFSESVSEPQLRFDLIKLILYVMRRLSREISVQLAGTACLYNLCRGDQAKSISNRLLADIINHVLELMTSLPHGRQLMKNCLVLLCQDRIIQDVEFDRFLCCTLVFDCLLKHDDATMCRLAVAICGCLGAKIPSQQSALLGGCRQYMRKLLSIIESKIETRTIDITLNYTLTTIWSLSDEAPETCESFITESGIQVYLNLLEVLSIEPEDSFGMVVVKMLGTLNNMAEIEHLKHNLMDDKVLPIIRLMLKSKHQDVSYFSGGIIAHLLSYSENVHCKLSGQTRNELLHELEVELIGWKQPGQAVVAYRSFVPFFKLLDVSNDAPVQMWALWVWRHVCRCNGAHYCSMLQREGGVDVLKKLLEWPNLSSDRPLVAQLTAEVMHILTMENSIRDC